MLGSLDRWRLGPRLVLGFAAALLLALGLGVQSLLNLRAVRDETHQMYEKDLLGLSHVKEANAELFHMGRAMRQALLAPDAAARARAQDEVVAAENALHRELEAARPLIFREENRRR